VRFAGNPREPLERLYRENDNLRAAFDRLEARGETQNTLRLAGALVAYWNSWQLLPEGRRALRRALAADESPTAARGKALAAAVVAELHGGDPAAARRRAEEALALHRQLGDAWWIARSLWLLGRAAMEVERDLAKAEQLFEESAARFRRLEDDRSFILATDSLARIHRSRGDLDRARPLHEQILDLTRATGDLRWESEALVNLADCALAEGRIADALPLLTEAIQIWRDLDGAKIQMFLWRVAWALALLGQLRMATCLVSLCERDDRAIAHSLPAVYVSWIAEVEERTLGIVRAGLAEDAFAAAWEQGRNLAIDEAVTLALDAIGLAGRPGAATPGRLRLVTT
jgi:tetratricopeptide (TPR) repeat protein